MAIQQAKSLVSNVERQQSKFKVYEDDAKAKAHFQTKKMARINKIHEERLKIQNGLHKFEDQLKQKAHLVYINVVGDSD